MATYFERFNKSFASAISLRNEIFSSNMSYKRKEDLWERITAHCIIYNQTAKWYFNT